MKTQNTALKKNRIKLSEFYEVAETGDIVFFRGKSLGGKVQRFFTRSEFDHVGLILRYKNEKIVLFEATGHSVSYL
jgi:hypothetical protein